MSLGRDVLSREEPFPGITAQPTLSAFCLPLSKGSYFKVSSILRQPEPVLSSLDPKERQAVDLNTSPDFIAQRGRFE